MKLRAVACLLLPLAAIAKHTHSASPARQAVLMPGLGNVHHAVNTKNPEAQQYFDQGLALIWAFNHEEALLSFERAAQLDPDCAMAYWGIALAVGPNYNDSDPDFNREKTAWDAVQKGLALAANAPPAEHDYLKALATRYTNEPAPNLKLFGEFYRTAMRELAKKYPDDLDASVLYAESIMDLNPWQLWTADGKPAAGTEEAVATLEAVLKRDPNHIGANHFYIHAVEASPHPERALASADRLAKLAPEAGHLVHMPAHIFIRMGDYANAARANEEAAEVDRAYIRKFHVTGMYPAMYYSHNLHFLAVAATIEGRFTEADNAAVKVVGNAAQMVKEIPMVEIFLPTRMFVLVRFHRWDEVLKLPEPDPSARTARALWHFSRGMAFAQTDKTYDADYERRAMLTDANSVPADAMFGFNLSRNILGLAAHMLEGHISLSRVSLSAAIEHFRLAAQIEDGLRYDEPPDWYIPARESLGRAYMIANRYADAEKAFRDELERHPLSGRALYGLWQCLKSEGKKAEAKQTESRFRVAWKNADVKLTLDDL